MKYLFTTTGAFGYWTPVIIYKSIGNLKSRIENERDKFFNSREELLKAIEYYYSIYKKKEMLYENIAEVTKELRSR